MKETRPSPFKYDIRVTGDLYVDKDDHATSTKVSVKIRGNEDGDVVVEQDDARSLSSPTPSEEEDGVVARKPQFTHTQGKDGVLQLHIKALPMKRISKHKPALLPAPAESISGGGGSITVESPSPSPTRLKAASSFGGFSQQQPQPQPSRATTRLSEYSRARAFSVDPSIVEITPAFEGDTESERTDSVMDSSMPVLVGGGARFRPRSSTFSAVTTEDKCTMTTFRGYPEELARAASSTPSGRVSAAQPVSRASAFSAPLSERSPSPALSTASSVLRGGGGGGAATPQSEPRRSGTDHDVFSAFNGPPVAPPEGQVGSSARPRSMSRQPLRPRTSAKDKINYRERAEALLTQYFPPEVLAKYLDELRRRHRFMGPGGIPASELAQYLDDTTSDAELKEQLRASFEELVRAPASGNSSDYEQSATSSQRNYLSIRDTELIDALDRTSMSPAPKSERSCAPSSILVGGGMSMDMTDASETASSHDQRHYDTIRTEGVSVAASVKPVESEKGSPALKPLQTRPESAKSMKSVKSVKSALSVKSAKSALSAKSTKSTLSTREPEQEEMPVVLASSCASPEPVLAPEPTQTKPEPPSEAPRSQRPTQQSHQQSRQQPPHQTGNGPSSPRPGPPPRQAGPPPRQSGPPPGRNQPPPGRNQPPPGRNQPPPDSDKFWEEPEKFKLRKPNMMQAFTVLKSQPIFVRNMPSASFDFKSPFSGRYNAPMSPEPEPEPSRGKFNERHPAEAKVAKAVSELEEVLRRTEAATRQKIEEDLQSSSGYASSHHRHSSPAPSRKSRYSHAMSDEGIVNDNESVVSHDSLVGGGASVAAGSARSASVMTRVSALSNKVSDKHSEAGSRYNGTNTTVRTEELLRKGMDYEDHAMEDEEDEAVVPVEPAVRNDSAVSLPMNLDDMPPELASVIRRTGGLDNTKLRRTATPASDRNSNTPLPEDDHQSTRSVASATSKAMPNQSLTELDIVMGRTGQASRSSIIRSQASVLRGGSGSTPVVPNDSEGELSAVMRRTQAVSPAPSTARGSAKSPAVANESDDELAAVMRRTHGFAPPASSYEPSVVSSRDLESRGSERKSPVPPESSSMKPDYGYPARNRTPSAASTHAPRQQQSPSQSPAASPVPSVASPRSVHSGYASSPLRGPVYQPSEHSVRSPGYQSSEHGVPPPMPQGRAVPVTPDIDPSEYQRESDYQDAEYPEDGSQARSPSPQFPKPPTPIFGRFPSPPPYIKNRGKTQQQMENEEEERRQQEMEQQYQNDPPPAQQQSRPQSYYAPSRASSHAQSQPRRSSVAGSVAASVAPSRQGKPTQGSEFGSQSTLMSADVHDDFQLPKVIEEDIDSLASYPSSNRGASPNLVGGGRGRNPNEPSTLRGGGGIRAVMSQSDMDILRHGPPARPLSTASHGGKAHSCDGGCCGVCGKGVTDTDAVVRPLVMHASCLKCEACGCALTTSSFHAIEGHVYCEQHFEKFFPSAKMQGKGVVIPPSALSDEKYRDMNRLIMESFTSVDDFLQHMRMQRKANGEASNGELALCKADPAQVARAGDIDLDRQTHFEREHVTSPSGTPYIRERVIDKKTKTKVLEKRYPVAANSGEAKNATPQQSTLMGGGGRPQVVPPRIEAARPRTESSASRPESSLLNDTMDVNGWDQPVCPVCSRVVYVYDRVTHEGYGYHKACMRCRQCSQVVPSTTAVRIKGAIYCKKHGGELMRRRSILMRKKSTMGRRTRNPRRRGGVSRERFSTDDAPAMPALPPMPMMAKTSSDLPVPQMPAAKEQPKRVSTALRNFLEAAAEQIENQSLMPVTPEPDAKHVLPEVDAHAMKRQEPEPRPLPVPKSRPHNVRTGGNTQQPSYIPMPPMQQKPMAPSSPRSPLSPTAGQLRSNSVFSGSHESTYDADVVNALRQEAQRQINTSSSNMGLSSAKPPNVPRMLTPRGPSLADNLQKYGGRSGRVSVSSQFDPFVASQDLIHRGVQPTSPRAGAHPPMDFAPNKQLDNLERRFRNANFRPPWSVKPQSAFN